MKFDLKRLFLLNNLLTALLPVICIGALSLLVVKSHLSKEMDHNGVLFTRSLASQITTYLQEPAGSFNLISRHLVTQKHSPADRTQLLDLLAESYEYFDALYLLDSRGIVQQAGFKQQGQHSRGDFQGMDFSSIDACRKALVDHKLHWDPSVSMSSGDPTMSFCGAINGGALLAELKLTDLGRIINEASAGRVFTSFIVDRAGRIIVHPNAEIARQKENIGNLPLVRMGLAGKESTDNFTFHRVEYRGTAILIPGLEWVLVVAQEMDTVMAPVQTLQRVLIIVILGTLVLAVSLGAMGSRLLRQPFEHLAENARLVIREDYEAIRPVTSPCQEIVLLSETLTGMVHAVRAREELLNEQTEELMATEEQLRDLNQNLEEKVAARTEQLAEANRELSALNDDLNQRELALEGANRQLEAFAFSVSHDLRAPLRHVTSFATILLDDYGAAMADDARELSQRIVASCRRMDELISGILEFSRVSRQPIKKVAMNVGSVVRDILQDMQGDLSGRSFNLKIGEVPDCQADPLLLRQVLTNLLSNAVKYTRLRDVAWIEVGALHESGETVYFVRDNGAGFDSAHADKLFGVFQRMHAATEFEGTGVGLAIVANIVQRHGGRVWAEAKPDAGATFFFTLPVQAERHVANS